MKCSAKQLSNKISGSSQENTYGEAPCRPCISKFATFLSSWFYHGCFPRNAEVFKDTIERLILRFSDILIWISVYMRVLFWPQSFFWRCFGWFCTRISFKTRDWKEINLEWIMCDKLIFTKQPYKPVRTNHCWLVGRFKLYISVKMRS